MVLTRPLIKPPPTRINPKQMIGSTPPSPQKSVYHLCLVLVWKNAWQKGERDRAKGGRG